jgi:hypothetical protein
MVLPVIPRPGAEVIYKRISRIPHGGIICTVSYLKTSKPLDVPVKKRRMFSGFASILSRFRGVFRAKLSRFGAK